MIQSCFEVNFDLKHCFPTSLFENCTKWNILKLKEGLGRRLQE